MMKYLLEQILLLLQVFFGTATKTHAAKSYCEFPSFIWSSAIHPETRQWISRVEFEGNSNVWGRLKEITVNRSDIQIRHKMYASCTGLEDNGSLPCYRRELVYHVLCLAEESFEKFRVQHLYDNKQMFSCLKFVRRSTSVVQVFQSVPSKVNEHRLCFDAALQRDDWPWIDPNNIGSESCPLSGGFSFTPYSGDQKQRICNIKLKQPRLESDCISGDGLTIYFPDKHCSPFAGHETELNLLCATHWTEESFINILLTVAPDRIPQYLLRLPGESKNADSRSTFMGFLYFSPVAPNGYHGHPPGEIAYLEMHLQRDEPGGCHDDVEECKTYLSDGLCHEKPKSGDQMGNCMKSCGLCADFAPNLKSECSFPKEIQGKWMLFVESSMIDMDIRDGRILSSVMGEFVCKSKHWELPYYKMLSVYNNGCRPRYTCFHLVENGEFLQFRMSSSSLKDQSFNICDFNNIGQLLTLSALRSPELKTLIPQSVLKFDFCGGSNVVHVNVSFASWRSCDGVMYSVDEVTCKPKPALTFRLHNCAVNNIPEMTCIASGELTTGVKFLVTRVHQSEGALGSGTLLCWIIKQSSSSHRKQGLVYSFVSCDTGEMLLSPADGDSKILFIQTYDDRVELCSRQSSSNFKTRDANSLDDVRYTDTEFVDDESQKINRLLEIKNMNQKLMIGKDQYEFYSKNKQSSANNNGYHIVTITAAILCLVKS